MSKGKYYSLHEARKDGNLKEFAKAHPSTGDRKLLFDTINAMAKKTAKADRTSKKG